MCSLSNVLHCKTRLRTKYAHTILIVSIFDPLSTIQGRAIEQLGKRHFVTITPFLQKTKKTKTKFFTGTKNGKHYDLWNVRFPMFRAREGQGQPHSAN